MRRIGAGFTVLFLSAWYLLGCAVHPITLEKQFMIISEEKEISIGKRSDPVILQQFGYYDDPALQEYVNEIGQKLAAVCNRKDITYYFKVVDSADINAFALPGGWIYVTRGILAMMNSEAELAGVLGHEIGHVVGRDSANMISQQTWFQIVALAGMVASPTTRELAMAGNMLFDAMMLGYGREKEFLADSQGVDYMFRAGYDPLQMVALQDSSEVRHRGDAFWVLTFDRVLGETKFVEDMREILTTLQAAYSNPVDIEFTVNFFEGGEYKINLLQCRTLQVKGTEATALPSVEIEEDARIIEARGAVIGQSRLIDVDLFVYVVPEVYGYLPIQQRHEVARLIGEINRATAVRGMGSIMLLGPGRWGTSSPSLGIPVSFADIDRVAQTYAAGRMRIKLLGAQEALTGGVARVVIGDARGERPLQRALAGEGTVIRNPNRADDQFDITEQQVPR